MQSFGDGKVDDGSGERRPVRQSFRVALNADDVP